MKKKSNINTTKGVEVKYINLMHYKSDDVNKFFDTKNRKWMWWCDWSLSQITSQLPSKFLSKRWYILSSAPHSLFTSSLAPNAAWLSVVMQWSSQAQPYSFWRYVNVKLHSQVASISDVAEYFCTVMGRQSAKFCNYRSNKRSNREFRDDENIHCQ